MLGAGRLLDCERVVIERLGPPTPIRDFSFERAAAIWKNDCAVGLEADELVDGTDVFAAQSFVEFSADRAKDTVF